jgi:peptidyl-prolyl cis-trans isomerase C
MHFHRTAYFQARKRSMAKSRFWIAAFAILSVSQLAFGQETEAVAARVNGQPIAEASVNRGLKRLPAARRAQARADIIDYLVGNVLIDQYLLQRSVEVTPAETAKKIDQLREELKKAGKVFEKALQEMGLSEDELKKEVTADLRWEKYSSTQATDAILRDIFTKNLEMFDGTLVRARHILLKKETGTPQELEAKIRQIRKQIEEDAAKESPKLQAITDKQARDQARNKLLENAFATVARKDSDCPSKAEGGDLGWFPRAGSMVEPFARAAFALKAGEMSDVVQTPFGCHLILVTDRRQGEATKFEDVKDVVKDFYSEKLREYLVGQLKPNAQIVITPAR